MIIKHTIFNKKHPFLNVNRLFLGLKSSIFLYKSSIFQKKPYKNPDWPDSSGNTTKNRLTPTTKNKNVPTFADNLIILLKEKNRRKPLKIVYFIKKDVLCIVMKKGRFLKPLFARFKTWKK